MVLSPLHACLFSLFPTLCNNFHKAHLNNLYMSVKFAHLFTPTIIVLRCREYVALVVGEDQGNYFKPSYKIRKHHIEYINQDFLIYSANICHH